MSLLLLYIERERGVLCARCGSLVGRKEQLVNCWSFWWVKTFSECWGYCAGALAKGKHRFSQTGSGTCPGNLLSFSGSVIAVSMVCTFRSWHLRKAHIICWSLCRHRHHLLWSCTFGRHSSTAFLLTVCPCLYISNHCSMWFSITSAVAVGHIRSLGYYGQQGHASCPLIEWGT